jgi:hypothetical protein
MNSSTPIARINLRNLRINIVFRQKCSDPQIAQATQINSNDSLAPIDLRMAVSSADKSIIQNKH